MRKLLFLACIASQSICASELAANMEFIPFVHKKVDTVVAANFRYSIDNPTDQLKNIGVCFRITTCSEWPYYVRYKSECVYLNVKPNQVISNVYPMLMKINYPITGWCSAIAKIETEGHTTQSKIQFQIG